MTELVAFFDRHDGIAVLAVIFAGLSLWALASSLGKIGGTHVVHQHHHHHSPRCEDDHEEGPCQE